VWEGSGDGTDIDGGYFRFFWFGILSEFRCDGVGGGEGMVVSSGLVFTTRGSTNYKLVEIA